jgi:hypothetical protein
MRRMGKETRARSLVSVAAAASPVAAASQAAAAAAAASKTPPAGDAAGRGAAGREEWGACPARVLPGPSIPRLFSSQRSAGDPPR